MLIFKRRRITFEGNYTLEEVDLHNCICPKFSFLNSVLQVEVTKTLLNKLLLLQRIGNSAEEEREKIPEIFRHDEKCFMLHIRNFHLLTEPQQQCVWSRRKGVQIHPWF